MPRTTLPAVTLIEGLRIDAHFNRYGKTRDVRSWLLVGRLGTGEPFLLSYDEGHSGWQCETTLGSSLRSKILRVFHETVEAAEPLPEGFESVDVRAAGREREAQYAKALERDMPGTERIMLSGAVPRDEVMARFVKEVWRARYLDDRDEDYVDLAVPFAQKDEAKALGARWEAERRVWVVKRREDMSAFARWLPAAGAEAATGGG